MPAELEEAYDNEMMVNKPSPLEPIDPARSRFPCCIVWTPLPLISWFVPFIGHMGICREDGTILDFAGPNFVCVDNFTFGAVARYMQLSREEIHMLNGYLNESCELTSWDDVLMKSTQEYQHRNYNLLTCNCHSFVANNLNRMAYSGLQNWNVVNLAILMFFKGTWVSKTSMVKSLLPFAVVFSLGLLLGGSNFIHFLLGLYLVFVGWFIVGTYCFKSLIYL